MSENAVSLQRLLEEELPKAWKDFEAMVTPNDVDHLGAEHVAELRRQYEQMVGRIAQCFTRMEGFPAEAVLPYVCRQARHTIQKNILMNKKAIPNRVRAFVCDRANEIRDRIASLSVEMDVGDRAEWGRVYDYAQAAQHTSVPALPERGSVLQLLMQRGEYRAVKEVVFPTVQKLHARNRGERLSQDERKDLDVLAQVAGLLVQDDLPFTDSIRTLLLQLKEGGFITYDHYNRLQGILSINVEQAKSHQEQTPNGRYDHHERFTAQKGQGYHSVNRAAAIVSGVQKQRGRRTGR